MRERRLVCLAMPQTSAGQIRAVGRINHGRTFPVPERSPAQSGDVGDELIERGINKIDELHLEHGAFPVRSETARDSQNSRFGEWRIEDLLWKFC